MGKNLKTLSDMTFSGLIILYVSFVRISQKKLKSAYFFSEHIKQTGNSS